MTRRGATIGRCDNGFAPCHGDDRKRRLASALAIGAGLLATACASEPPRPTALREDIPAGPYTLRIMLARNVPDPPPPISTFRAQPGKKGIVVFVSWKGLEDLDPMRRLAFIENFLENQLSVSDAAGEETEAVGAMQERLMFMDDPGQNWRDWVVVFYVPEDSRDLTLLVENPEPRDDQARVTATPLGM
jgi:hypothetical protein